MAEKSLKKNAFFNIIRKVMSLVFPLITFPYASRILLPEGIGKVNFATSVVSYFAMLASLGIAGYGIREGAKVRNDFIAFSKFAKELFSLNLIATAVSYILFFISLLLIPKFQEYRVLLCVCSSTLLLNAVGIDWLYSALEEYKYIAVRSIVFQFISLFFLFAFVKTADDYIKYACFGILSSVGSNVCNFIHSRKYINLFLHVKLELKKHLKPVFILFASSVAISIYTVLDTTMLGFMTNDVQVGYYSAAVKIVRMIRDLFPAVFAVLYARLSSYAVDADVNVKNKKIQTLIDKTLNFIMCFSMPIMCGLFVFMDFIVRIMCGPEYAPVVGIALPMLPLLLFSSVAGFLGGSILVSQGKESLYLRCVLIGAFSDVVLNLLLIGKWQALGASIATCVTEAIFFLLYIFLTRKFLHKSMIKSFLQYAAASVVLLGLIVLFRHFIKNQIVSLFVSIVCGGSCYFLVLVLIKNRFVSDIINSFMKRK